MSEVQVSVKQWLNGLKQNGTDINAYYISKYPVLFIKRWEIFKYIYILDIFLTNEKNVLLRCIGVHDLTDFW